MLMDHVLLILFINYECQFILIFLDQMKRKINLEVLRMMQQHIINKPPRHLSTLHQLSYELIKDMIVDIKRPFTNICIHGRDPQLILPVIYEHNKKYNLKNQQVRITLVDWLRNQSNQKLLDHPQYPVKQIRYIQNPDLWLGDDDIFDLILSSLTLHHANSEEQVLRKYIRTLKSDGALIGCSFGQGTLSQLYWSYLLAQNQRYGGISPKVLTFPPLGQFGTLLTTTNYHIPTILNHEQVFQFQSFLDLISLIQSFGESGFLRGRRKGIYKDLLLAVSAIYCSEFGNLQNQRLSSVRSTICLNKFIAWKYHPSQAKTLQRGPNVDSKQFITELKKYDPDVQNFLIKQGDDEPKQI